MTYTILTPTDQIQVEVDDLELLLKLLCENDLEWHYVGNIIGVWLMVSDSNKIRDRVDHALSLYAQPKKRAESLPAKVIKKSTTVKNDLQIDKPTDIIKKLPPQKVVLNRTAEEWSDVLEQARNNKQYSVKR